PEFIGARGVVAPRQRRGARLVCAAVALSLGAGLLALWPVPAGAITVSDESAFRAAWSNPAETRIDLATDITLSCGSGTAERDSATPLTLDGHGHTITPACADRPALVVLNATSVDNSSPVTFRNVTINRGNATDSVALTSSSAAVSAMSQLITVEVRRRHQQPHRQLRPHEPRAAPAAPVPARPVLAGARFTG